MSGLQGKTLVVRCVDERYTTMPEARAQLPQGYDITGPGASLWFLNNPESLFAQIGALQAAGVVVGRIILADHYDAVAHHGCKAYGRDDSTKRHQQNLRALARRIVAKPEFSEFQMELLLHDIDHGTVEEVALEEVAEAVAA
jgi:hypothetical protein